MVAAALSKPLDHRIEDAPAAREKRLCDEKWGYCFRPR
jgi:hypothetical protein